MSHSNTPAANASEIANKDAKVRGIAAIHYAVKDITRASAFWKPLLDIAETTFELDEATEWILRDGSAFVIGTFSGEWAPSSGALLDVADADATAALVKSLGGRLDGAVRDFGLCRMQWCEDPDGNIFVLHQSK